ncbi:MAG TPA: hypothetical protein VI703_09415 [Anaerolineales bacterium]|nr:hypothetical protein [Anaerolineales bacterium]
MKLGNKILLGFVLASVLMVGWASPPPAAAQTLCEGEGTITKPPRFGRLMHDWQWMEWPSRMADPDWNRGFYLDWYPETVKLWSAPGGGEGSVSYNKEWLQYLRELQPNDYAAVWITEIAAGLFNRGNQSIPILNLSQLKKEPVAAGVSSGGNVVKILEFASGSGRIEMIYSRSQPPSVLDLNYRAKPWLVTKFTSVSIDGRLGNAGGIDVFFPNLAKQTEGYWVDLKRVELFPALPYCAVVKETLVIHTAPAIFARAIGKVTAGDQVTVREYLPQGSNVWGRTDEGWILLEYLNRGVPLYPTNWEMETRPPIYFD